MNRILLGAAIGAALVYFLDVERGAARRQRASDFASQYVNADTMDQARQAGRSTMNQARSLTNSVTNSVGSQVSQLRNRRSSSGDLAATNSSTLTSSNS
jgi:hypothetical protein